jgi:hypothetical protein
VLLTETHVGYDTIVDIEEFNDYPFFKQKSNNKNYTIYSNKKISIRVITKLPNSEQSYKGKVKTHNYINRQNQSTTGKQPCIFI